MSARKLINFLAYVAVILIVLSTLISYLSTYVFSWEESVSNVCRTISYYLAIIVTVASAFIYALSKRNRVFLYLLVLFVFAFVLFTFVV